MDTSPTDIVEPRPSYKPPQKSGKNAKKQARIDNFRSQKSKTAEAAIMAGIYARLKCQDPTTVPQVPVKREVHPVTVPVTFQQIPTFIERVWDVMEAIGTRPFTQLNTTENKNVFKKGVLILHEAKVCYAQRAKVDKPDEDLGSRKVYTEDQLIELNGIAETLPLPIALSLESIGNVTQDNQVITPVTAQFSGTNAPISGAMNYAPSEVARLVGLLNCGVPVNGLVHETAQIMNSLPGIEWQEFVGPAIPPRDPPTLVRLSAATKEFWTNNDGSLKWTDHESRIFKKIIQSMGIKKGFNIKVDLSHGQGSMAQTVRCENWTYDQPCQWHTMTDVSEYDQKLGMAFGFGSYLMADPSRYTGTRSTAYWRGDLTPKRVIQAILSPFDNISSM